MATALINPRQPLPRNPRVASAWHPALRAKLEYLDQPTYDSVSFNAGASAAQVFFFNVGLGGAENNGGAAAATIRAANKSLLNTNLLTPNVFSNPKLFIVTGIGLTWQQFITNARPVVSAAIATNAFETRDEEDIRNYTYLTWFQFTIGGPKSYLNVPMWQIPAEYGVGGAHQTADNAGLPPRSALGMQLTGRPYTLDDMQLLIPPQQTFSCTLNHDVDTAANISGTAAVWTFLQEERLWCTLWGVLGREVQ